MLWHLGDIEKGHPSLGCGKVPQRREHLSGYDVGQDILKFIHSAGFHPEEERGGSQVGRSQGQRCLGWQC